MPVTGPEALPDRQTPLLASGGESVRVSAIILGAYKFPTTDSRDDVGFLGSLPLSPRTKSKPVTPLSGTAVRSARLKTNVSRPHRHSGIRPRVGQRTVQGAPFTVQPVGRTGPRSRLAASKPNVRAAP